MSTSEPARALSGIEAVRAAVTRFEPDQSKWIDAVCFNIDDPSDAREYKLGTTFDSPRLGERPIVETFEELLHRYFYHPEIRQGFGRRIIEKISRRDLVKASTYREYGRRIDEYARRRKRPKRSL